MWNKPFKPLTVRKTTNPPDLDPVVIRSSVEPESEHEPSPRPVKKRRLIHIVDDEDIPHTTSRHPSPKIIQQLPRKPLLAVTNIRASSETVIPSQNVEGYYMVLWRRFTTKKHKTWDGDGVLALRHGYAHLQDVSGREMGKCAFVEPLLPGSTLSIGGKDVEVDTLISKEDFLAGRPFLNTGGKQNHIPKPGAVVNENLQADRKKPPITSAEATALTVAPSMFYAPVPPKSAAIKSHFKTPLLSTTVLAASKDGTPTPRHDPNAEGAMVMTRPTFCPKGRQIVDVVLDPFLGQWLRDHQREGVKFLYECVMGMRSHDGQGALLADDMGLGKTFTTIALIYTLMKQNPIYGNEPVIKKALIVCPATLIHNWRKEFKRWLGNERLGIFVADGKNNRLTDFTHGKSYSVMIIGYEKLRNVQDDLKKGYAFDLIVCDEGHRLKTEGNKAGQAIKALNTPRRIVLSGTPLQNDLGEFFVMVDFVNPGILGAYKTFKKEFETPIEISRTPEASANEREKGEARAAELAGLTKQFILRREAGLLNKYLPPKAEYVLFCKPTVTQAEIYQHVLDSPIFSRILGSTENSLQIITLLKKVCNSPTLLNKHSKMMATNDNVARLIASIPSHLLRVSSLMASCKIRVLDGMLRYLSKETTEKIVLVSNYTSTLDLLAQHLTTLSLSYLRLDGSTPSAKRQDIVDEFNKGSRSKSFAFLLSAKSGGAGINLIGASRLVLFDVDWNPATDLQAMARIHRDGQKRPVKIYRFLMAGGMDEKIFQRQITKTGLAHNIMDGKKTESSFSAAELRDLFRLDQDTNCQTHDLLGCECEGMSVQPQKPMEIDVLQEELVYDTDNGSDDDLSLPANPAVLMPASRVDMARQEEQIEADRLRMKRQKSRGKMQALMQYAHVDTSVFAAETKDVFDNDTDQVVALKAALADDILDKMLEEKKYSISYTFVKHG